LSGAFVIALCDSRERDGEGLETTLLVQVKADSRGVMYGEVCLTITVHLYPLIATHRGARINAAGGCYVLKDTSQVPEDSRRSGLSCEEEIRLLVSINVTPLSFVDACDSSQASGDRDVLEVTRALVEQQGYASLRGDDEGVRLAVPVVVMPEEVFGRLSESGSDEGAKEEIHVELLA
jgi:hypothetical protein